jgi:hypothetical protein
MYDGAHTALLVEPLGSAQWIPLYCTSTLGAYKYLLPRRLGGYLPESLVSLNHLLCQKCPTKQTLRLVTGRHADARKFISQSPRIFGSPTIHILAKLLTSSSCRGLANFAALRRSSSQRLSSRVLASTISTSRRLISLLPLLYGCLPQPSQSSRPLARREPLRANDRLLERRRLGHRSRVGNISILENLFL